MKNKIKSKTVVIQAGTIPGKIEEMIVPEGTSIADVRKLINAPTGSIPKVDGLDYHEGYTLNNKQIVLFVTKISGN